MKARFTLSRPRPGQVVSGVEIEVDSILSFDWIEKHSLTVLRGSKEIYKDYSLCIVKETPEEVRQIIEATRAQNEKPHHITDDN